MPIIEYGEWLPDRPDFGNTCITARNVYPAVNGYIGMRNPVVITDALPGPCIGAISFKRGSGQIETFAGTETKLYRKNGSDWDDVTDGMTDYTAPQWRFAVYGERLVATNGSDNVQKFDLGSDTEFSDLSGAPKHRFPMVVRDVLVALDLTDGSGADVKWSAVNDSEDWTTGAGGGEQNLPDGGRTVGGTGGEYGVILQENALTRMTFVGGDLRFTFDNIEGGIGCIGGSSIVRYKGNTFFLSEEGFQIFDGAQSRNISEAKVTRRFFQELSTVEFLITDDSEFIITDAGEEILVGAVNLVEGALDPKNSCVVWNYPTSTGNKLLIYNYRLDRWSDSDESTSILHTFLDTSGPVLAGFNASNELTPFYGAQKSGASLSTGLIQMSRGRSSFIRSVRGLVDSTHNVTVGKKTDLNDTESTVTGSSNSNGKVSLRSHGRYHRIQLNPTGIFTEISGVDVEASTSGARV
jgi:hypothetical protein